MLNFKQEYIKCYNDITKAKYKMNQNNNTMKTENNNSEITINVLPDNQAMGKTLNALLAYL